MDSTTVFTKTAKGLMEATGKTSVLSRDMRALLKEIDGKATMAELQAKRSKMPETKLQETLQELAKNDFIREFKQAQTAAAARSAAAADLDFTTAIPTLSARAKTDMEEARRRVQAAAAEAARAKAEAEARARADAEAQAKRDAEEKAQREAERKARKEAEAKARRETDELRAKLEEERKAKEEAERQRRQAEAKARREADELRARLEQERQAREDAEREAKEEAERQRRQAEAKAQREADELRARLEQERQAREDAERKAKEEAERQRKEAEAKAQREADELRARLEQERQAHEDAERKAKEEADRQRKEAEAKARREADELRARLEQERQAREDAEREAKEEADRQREEAKAQREADEQTRREAEGHARAEAGEQTPAPAPAGGSLDDLVKVETDFDAVLGVSGDAAADVVKDAADERERSRREAEDAALRQAGDEAAREAEEEEKARARAAAAAAPAAPEHGRKEEDERQRERAPEAADEQASAYARAHAEERALLAAQDAETERHFAEMEKELEAERAAAGSRNDASEPREPAHGRAEEEAGERVRVEAAAPPEEEDTAVEPAAAVYRTPVKWGRPAAMALFLILLVGLVLVHFVSFEAYIPQFEKLAGTYLQQPVKIKALHLSLLPRPHWRLDGVAVGNEGQLAVARVNAIPELGSMFSEKKAFSAVELESPVLGEGGLPGLLFGKPAGRDFKVASIVAKNAKLDSKTFILPALDARISLGEDGAWRRIALETPDHKTSLLLMPEGDGAQIEVETNAFSMPFHPSFILEDFTAKGVLRRGELQLSELKGGIYGGYLSGTASIKWDAGWSLGGGIKVREMDPDRFAPALLAEGKLEGSAVYAMRAKSYDELFAAPRMEGSFAIRKGVLLGVDLGRLLQGGAVGGKTRFTELTGAFVREAGKTLLRQIRLGDGPVSAGGSAEVEAGERISGRFSVELKSPVAHARAGLGLSGTLADPRFGR